ncbi:MULTISPECIES: type II-A CRISPR-associated protein Csn2 [Gordonibacter]|uniref:Type II-A CRISPR-associated protein Csn2 n=1 Tax=Gordonibacter faecis TaxID=3047475 RepID=A0ABT7DML4_9ACTN|nr:MULTISPECIES: type II-A CRISPR-associated protein Csn2 [unclassified Gordonibacter]MDJ1650772.1 type II-A CRISPR-associated protein Csn2 [Gordonibacter sp. KGMB12511]HIW77198.1 type II-A CRISPR-associated protein Csn2 [Candidatus Gordonibacter avicola]
MNLSLSGFSESLALERDAVSVVEIHNRTLFARVCQSFFSELDEAAVEPYALWEGEERRSSRNYFLFVFNPFELPWTERALFGEVLERVENMFLSEDKERQEIETMGRALSDRVASLGLRLKSDYAFEVQWDMRKYLKAFDFGVDIDPSDSLLDNLIKFLKFASDAAFAKQLVFVNLKQFLEENELQEFYRQAVFSELKVLLLENVPDDTSYEYERKMCIDKDFLQS